MRQSEHVLYITLIDFLLQLLFLGMVVSVIYAISEREQAAEMSPAQVKESIEFVKSTRNLTGISNLTEITDHLTRLGPLNQAGKDAKSWRDISGTVEKMGGKEAAEKFMSEQIAKGSGQGFPSCLPDKANLATFHAYPDRIELGNYNLKEFASLIEKLGIKKESVEQLTLSEFSKVFGPVKSFYPECRFNVILMEHSFDTRPRDSVRAAFFVIPRPAPSRR